MKKLLSVFCALMLCSSPMLVAQNAACHFEIYGGVTTNNFSSIKSAYSELKGKPMVGWNAGAGLQIKLPAYFSIIPSVEYNNVNLSFQNYGIMYEGGEIAQVRQHLVTVPIPIQWGPDLGIIRPFVQVVPFVNFNVGGRFKTVGSVDDVWHDAKGMFSTAQFGFGAGGGLELWKFIISVRYNWILGAWEDIRPGSGHNPFANFDGKRRGLTITLGFNF